MTETPYKKKDNHTAERGTNGTNQTAFYNAKGISGSNFKRSTGNDGKLQKPIDLSAVPELQNVPAKKTITFRLYAWGSKEGSENTAFRIGKSTADRPALTVQGTAWKK